MGGEGGQQAPAERGQGGDVSGRGRERQKFEVEALLAGLLCHQIVVHVVIQQDATQSTTYGWLCISWRSRRQALEKSIRRWDSPMAWPLKRASGGWIGRMVTRSARGTTG